MPIYLFLGEPTHVLSLPTELFLVSDIAQGIHHMCIVVKNGTKANAHHHYSEKHVPSKHTITEKKAASLVADRVLWLVSCGLKDR